MSKWKFAAFLAAFALATAPVSSAFATEDTVPPAPTEEETPPPATDDGNMCPDPDDEDEDEDDDEEDEDDDEDQDGEDDTDGDTPDDNTDDPTDPADPADPTDGTSPAQPSIGLMKDGDKGNKGKGHDKQRDKDKDKDDDKDQDGDGVEDRDADDSCGEKKDNGKHKGWTHKIENMVKKLDELTKQLSSIQKKLDELKAWAKQNGSASDLEALKSIEEALKALDTAGEATPDDLVVLSETQDLLADNDGAILSLEKAAQLNYENEDIYQRLSKQHVKKGDTKKVKVYVAGKKPTFDVEPTVVEGRTLVPLRAIGEALNAEVKWDEATQTVTLTNKDGRVVTLQINSTQATVDGKVVTLDVPAKKINNRTLVPLRALGNFFNLDVQWDAASSMAILK